ncbi:protein unc-13 homolog 4B isoform X3 [Hermetia illucens]|uniref:protein unc-13 homolog 4B isoform X3 n=1 Tax=Hermetia illucens TaxID=343691 RepID=UPI0018CC171D|nr:protein unc-13 homolog 4B isoform X3 [Hermetia illucens]
MSSEGLYTIIFKTHSPKFSTKSRFRIQDIDGGFFERFGSLLRQKSQMEEVHITPLAPLPEEIDHIEEDTLVQDIAPRMLDASCEAENDSGTETLNETDSEPDEREKHESFIGGVVGMNIDELYEEILYEVLNGIGCEASSDICQEALYDYIQEAFKITNDRHEEILEAARIKEPPEIRLNVEVIKAENLVPKDSNGFSDPFVTLYLESCGTHRYNTSVKPVTLNPLWEEHFSLSIPENPNNEILVVEVWDFDAAETVGEKLNKFFEVKGIRGLRKLMKEIAVTASTGKHDNELIGRTAIPLKTIPASGIKVWYNLEKGGRTKSRGSILIRMSFSAEKNNRVAVQEHKHLLRILLMHELETSKVAPFWWRGKFSPQGEVVLTQHSAQSSLNEQDCALAQWSVYAAVHQDHHLSFGLFISILDKIVPVIETMQQDSEDMRSFWEGAKRLLPSCFSIIRKIRKKNATDKNTMKMLNEALEIISRLALLEPPEGTDLFPKQIYGWITREGDEPNCDIRETMRDAVNSGAMEWFEHINDGNECPKGSDEERLQHLIKLIQLIRSDLQKAIELYDRQFQQKLRFHYAQTLYLFYEKKLAEQVKTVVEDVCRNIKRLNISEDKMEKLPDLDEINMGTTLFELYLVLKRFTTLGTALCPGVEDLSISQYYLWFTTGVSHWLDISVYRALTRIEKAIDLDKLVPVDETVKYSSSAVDTLAIFYQIKIFWQQLGWPDAEGAYMFVGKIVDDICRCCVYYADKMARRVDELCIGASQDGFEVTKEWCLAINNIDYIRQSLQPFIKELGLDDIIARLAEYRSSLEADRCAETLKNVVENAIDTERNKIIQLIEVVARKMCPAMRRFLVEGAEVLHEGSHSMERLLIYMEESLKMLNTELNEVNFERILDAIWTELATVLYEVVQSNLDKKRPPAFFANLRDTLHLMVTSFKLSQNSTNSDKETLENIERTLELHAYETADLIHQYYLERLKDQQNMEDCPYGELTVRCNFVNNKLELEIMNARNLLPMDSNGNCDSFVKVHFMPSDKFGGIGTQKTGVQNKTLFPLYDEKFVIPLTPDQLRMHTALLVFSVKDKDLFGMSNQYLAECYLSFEDIENSQGEQIHMKLSRPIYKDTDCVRALEYRTGDKQARDFIKKLKQKSSH